jgi:hypothetical protein
MSTGFRLGNLRERDHWGDPDVDGRIILRCVKVRVVHRVLVGKPEGKRPLERPRRRWEEIIKMDGRQRCAQASGGEI